MTNLAKLNVSLTKHGAHKIAVLLKSYDKDQLIAKIQAKADGVDIDLAQARKNLSIGPNGVLPVVWNAARSLGPGYVDALAFVAIIFSHNNLIAAMRAGKQGHFVGAITRGAVLNGKEYTNFAHTIEMLGFSTSHNTDKVSYDVSKLFSLAGTGGLAREILTLKLQVAGWSGVNAIEDECVALGLHEVFAVQPDEFSAWLTSKKLADEIEDLDFFEGDDSSVKTSADFAFVSGHNSKKMGAVQVNAGGPKTANLLHNEIQNKLFQHLSDQFGKDNVGTEVPTGDGTSIDLVVRGADGCAFYEIKTASSIKACIRQAIPQLLEYAYWRGNSDRASRLIIVSPHKNTTEAETYLAFLQKNFGVPLEYQQYVP